MLVIKAKESGYLTQVEDIADSERDYVTEISTTNPDEYKNWRDADKEEYQAWVLRTESQLEIEMEKDEMQDE